MAVEFAFVGLAFVSLLFLVLETGWQLLVESALNAGAMAASRFGSNGATVAAGITPAPTDRISSIQGVVLQSAGGVLLASRLQIQQASYVSFAALASDVTQTNGVNGAGTGNQVVHYTLTYTEPYLTPIAAAIAGKTQMIHTVQVTVLNEPFPSN